MLQFWTQRSSRHSNSLKFSDFFQFSQKSTSSKLDLNFEYFSPTFLALEQSTGK